MNKKVKQSAEMPTDESTQAKREFLSNGTEVLARCPEMILLSLFDGFEYPDFSPEVSKAMLENHYRVLPSDSITSSEDRIALARALLLLRDHSKRSPSKQRDPKSGGLLVAKILSETLGDWLLKITNSEGKDVEGAIADCVTALKGGLRAFCVAEGLLPDRRRKKSIPNTSAVVNAAVKLFKETRQRPTKSAILKEIELQGLSFDGKTKKERWSDIFTKAGFGNLPD